MAATSSRNAWAVGYSHSFLSPDFGVLDDGLIEHWNGTAWKVQAGHPAGRPRGGAQSNILFGVTAISSTNAWAVGAYDYYGYGKQLVAQWSGSDWAALPSPNTSGDYGNVNDLYGVAAISSTTAWVVGAYYPPGVSPPGSGGNGDSRRPPRPGGQIKTVALLCG